MNNNLNEPLLLNSGRSADLDSDEELPPLVSTTQPTAEELRPRNIQRPEVLSEEVRSYQIQPIRLFLTA